jgi:2-oxoglutarate ferredoxin oxidoreductase subunit gamma
VRSDLTIAGFGGQGVLFAGQLLAHAALDAGLHTTWYPSYGPEMRGGTANCTVILSDTPIGSPVVAHPQNAIVMNLPSLDRYEGLLAPGGLLMVNASLVTRAVARTDLDVIRIAADDIAAELGHPRLTNMVLLGAYLARRKPLSFPALLATLARVLPERHQHLLGANRAALHAGAELAHTNAERADHLS